MSHKKVISLANRFFLKLAYIDETTNLRGMPRQHTTKPDGSDSENDLPELPSHLMQLVQNPPQKEEMTPANVISKPEEMTPANVMIKPEERQISEELYGYAKSIALNLANDFDSLKRAKYWEKHPKEQKAFDIIVNKFNELLPMTTHSPYAFKIHLTNFLNSKPEIRLHSPTKPASETQMDNLQNIYYDSYSNMIIRHTNMGLSGGKSLKPVHPKGIRMLMMFDLWMEKNM